MSCDSSSAFCETNHTSLDQRPQRMSSSMKSRRARYTRHVVLRKARILPAFQILCVFLSLIDLSRWNRQHFVARALLPELPFVAVGRIRNTVYGGSLNERNNIHFDFNHPHRDSNSIPAHEQLLSSNQQIPKGDQRSSEQDVSPFSSLESPNMTPLKVMIFIDGTWLYYSIYERSHERDVIAQKLGKYWRAESTPDWSRLPTVACQALLQDPKAKWSAIMPVGSDGHSKEESFQPSRPIEVSRVSVYSSMHRDTPTDSFRYKMFADMMKAGFDVNMMETVGKGEKCVDIQLAVDMLYYATVPDAYDVALLLTGDRDFLPAVIRCRQKGRRIGLVSMRSGSLAFEVTPNLKDYDTIWLEDYLSEWIRKKTPDELSRRPLSTGRNPGDQSPKISAYTLNKVITNFLEKAEAPRVSSRDMGRHLKALTVGEKSMLDEIKAVYGGLYQFLVLAEIYLVEADSRRGMKAFWVSMQDPATTDDAKAVAGKENLSDDEKKFLKVYEKWMPQDKDKEYEFTRNEQDSFSHQSNSTTERLNQKTPTDYSTLTVPELKEICREKGLRVSARKKIELIERIQEHDSKEAAEDASPEKYLESLIREYLHASGGQASSRDVGRYLAANKVSHGKRGGEMGQGTSALAELKDNYGSLKSFVKTLPYLYILSAPGHEFNICVQKDTSHRRR